MLALLLVLVLVLGSCSFFAERPVHTWVVAVYRVVLLVQGSVYVQAAYAEVSLWMQPAEVPGAVQACTCACMQGHLLVHIGTCIG